MSPPKICLDPGHGLYRTSSGAWSFQRDEEHGVLEDLMSVVLAAGVSAHLEGRVQVLCTRAEHRDQTLGASGHPRWHEDAFYHLERVAPKLVVGIQNDHPGTSAKGAGLFARAEYANEQGAQAFLSVHLNASGTQRARGFEVWVAPDDDRRAASSRTLAQILGQRLVALDLGPWRGVKGLARAGTPEGDWARKLVVLNRTKMPAALVECLFFDNEEDAAILKNPKHQDAMSRALAQGLVEFLGQ